MFSLREVLIAGVGERKQDNLNKRTLGAWAVGRPSDMPSWLGLRYEKSWFADWDNTIIHVVIQCKQHEGKEQP